MRILMLLFSAASIAAAQTGDVRRILVIGDRVSLRAIPNLEGDLLDRAMRGEELACLDTTNGWVAVQAPGRLDFWVAEEYITNGVVLPEKLNVRSGPSRNYKTVASLQRGAPVSIRGKFNNWLKIAPPAGSRVWISEDYVKFIESPISLPDPELAAVPESEPDPQTSPLIKRTPEEQPSSLILVLDKSKTQGEKKQMAGVLHRANSGLYKLVRMEGHTEKSVCLVRGHKSQLETMLDRPLLIEGKVYWIKEVDLPVIQPDTIHLNPLIVE